MELLYPVFLAALINVVLCLHHAQTNSMRYTCEFLGLQWNHPVLDIPMDNTVDCMQYRTVKHKQDYDRDCTKLRSTGYRPIRKRGRKGGVRVRVKKVIVEKSHPPAIYDPDKCTVIEE